MGRRFQVSSRVLHFVRSIHSFIIGIWVLPLLHQTQYLLKNVCYALIKNGGLRRLWISTQNMDYQSYNYLDLDIKKTCKFSFSRTRRSKIRFSLYVIQVFITRFILQNLSNGKLFISSSSTRKSLNYIFLLKNHTFGGH